MDKELPKGRRIGPGLGFRFHQQPHRVGPFHPSVHLGIHHEDTIEHERQITLITRVWEALALAFHIPATQGTTRRPALGSLPIRISGI